MVDKKCVKKTGQWSSSPFRAKYPRVLNLNTTKHGDDLTGDQTDLVRTPVCNLDPISDPWPATEPIA